MPKFSVLSKEDARKNIKFAQTLEKNLRKYLHNLGAQVLAEVQKKQAVYVEGMDVITSAQLRGEQTIDIPFVGQITLREHATGFDFVNNEDLLESETDSPARGTTKKLTQPWRSSIPKHKRRLSSGRTITVRAHTKTYKEWYKPVKFGGNWIAVDINKRIDQISGEQMLQNAWQTVRDKQDAGTRKTLPKNMTTL